MARDYFSDSTYVIHAKTGYEEHGKRIVSLFKQMDLPFEFMWDGDVSNFTDELLNKYFTEPVITFKHGLISCYLNHLLCYEKIIERKSKYALIFEDDVFFIRKDFKKRLEAIMLEAESLPESFLISLENTSLEFPSARKVKSNKLLYPAKHGRCAGAYVIDLKAAQNINHFLSENKCNTTIDLWHNYLAENNVFKIYWAHPPLTEQGSHNGLMSSTISTEKLGNIRRIKWLLQKFYKYYIRVWLK